jgi:hypothetical protein
MRTEEWGLVTKIVDRCQDLVMRAGSARRWRHSCSTAISQVGVFYGRLVSSGAANGTQHHWMTDQCRAPLPCRGHDACLLRTSVPPGQGPITVRLPLLQSPHRRLANPATGAAHAQEEREETNACDEPSNALIQLLTPYHWFPLRASACLSEYPGIRLLTRTLWASCPLLLMRLSHDRRNIGPHRYLFMVCLIVP